MAELQQKGAEVTQSRAFFEVPASQCDDFPMRKEFECYPVGFEFHLYNTLFHSRTRAGIEKYYRKPSRACSEDLFSLIDLHLLLHDTE